MAANNYPDGKLNEDDEGELNIKIIVEQGNVIIAFGKPITWIGLPPEKAIELANIIKARASEIIN